MWGFKTHEKFSNWLERRRKIHKLPLIQIKSGAKIANWDQYSQLVGLYTEFEATNGIDDKSLLGR